MTPEEWFDEFRCKAVKQDALVVRSVAIEVFKAMRSQARAEALEEAAELVDSFTEQLDEDSEEIEMCEDIADGIRALKEQPSAQGEK